MPTRHVLARKKTKTVVPSRHSRPGLSVSAPSAISLMAYRSRLLRKASAETMPTVRLLSLPMQVKQLGVGLVSQMW